MIICEVCVAVKAYAMSVGEEMGAIKSVAYSSYTAISEVGGLCSTFDTIATHGVTLYN